MSSLGAVVKDHSTSGSSRGGRATPRCEADPPEATIVPYRAPKPLAVLRLTAVGAMSPGDAFTTALTGRDGRVLAHSTVDISEPEETTVMEPATRQHPMGKRTRVPIQPPREMRPVTLVEIEGERKLLARNTMVFPK